MGEQTGIEWCDHTFNPWMGCTKVSAGCANCYAEREMDHRHGRVKWGDAGTRVRTSASYWRQPYSWAKAASAAGIRRRVFCASLADVFEDRPELVQWRRELFALIAATPELDWLLLTKRPENVMRHVRQIQGDAAAQQDPLAVALYDWARGKQAPPNVWIGTSVEDQTTAETRVPCLVKIPATVRFLSCEPLLGPVDVTGICDQVCGAIDWVIVGGESGPKARPTHPKWARDLRDQCAAAGVPFFFKQWGEWIAVTQYAKWAPDIDPIRGWVRRPEYSSLDMRTGEWGLLKLDGKCYPKQTTWNCRQEDPCDDHEVNIHNVGKRAAGRLLDGVLHDAFPGCAAGVNR